MYARLDEARLDVFDSDEETAFGSDGSEDSSYLEKMDSPLSKATPTPQHLPLRLRGGLSNRLSQCLTSIVLIVLPSFISRRILRLPARTTPANGIAALDGLRGLACLFVFNEHVTYNYTQTFLFGYSIEDHRTFVQWPIVRVMWAGFAHVAIFYVISGYVLSYKPLRQIRAKEISQVQQTLASSILRRAIRLYIPSIVAVLLAGVLAWAGIFTYATRVFEEDNGFNLHEHPPPVIDSFSTEMEVAIDSAFKLAYFWDWSFDGVHPGDYDLHLWTIPVEFRCSMVLFLVLVATSRMRQNFRLLYVGLFMIYCVATERKDALLFIAGMFLAEIDMIRKGKQVVLLPSALPVSRMCTRAYRKVAWIVIFVAGLYLASAPVFGPSETPGFVFLASHVPSCYRDRGWFLRSGGAILITWAAANSNELNVLFTNPFSRYLGKISYAFYIVHGNVLKSLLFSSLPRIYAFWNAFESYWGFIFAWVTGFLLCFVVSIWLADLFWRIVDVPVVDFGRWVETLMSEEFPIEENSARL